MEPEKNPEWILPYWQAVGVWSDFRRFLGSREAMLISLGRRQAEKPQTRQKK